MRILVVATSPVVIARLAEQLQANVSGKNEVVFVRTLEAMQQSLQEQAYDVVMIQTSAGDVRAFMSTGMIGSELNTAIAILTDGE